MRKTVRLFESKEKKVRNHLKKIYGAGLALCLLLCLMASPVCAEDKKVIRVAFPELPGFSTTDASGRHSGYTYEFLEEVARYTGWEYEFITGDGSNESLLKMMEDLKNGEIDIMGGMLYSEELARDYDFPEYNCGYSYSTLSVAEDNQAINESNYSTFNNIKVGVRATATRRIQALQDFCKANGITLEISEYNGDDEVLQQALHSGEVDAVLGSDVTLSDDERIVARFDGRPYYFAVTKGNSEVISGINTATAAIIQEDPNYATNLYMKYFDKGNQRVTLEHFVKANPTESIAAALGIGLVLAAVVGMTMYIRMQRNQQMLLNYERYRILSEMSQELIFEYNYQEDSIVVSERYAGAFDGKSHISHFAATMLGGGPESSESIRAFTALIERRPPAQARYEVEYKTTVPGGSEEWVRGTSVIIYDRHGQPLRAVGKIVNINQERCEKEALISQARHDALTGLYNRATFEELVNEYLNAEGDQEGAMMLVDLDHFKDVNDTLGHQGGDEVLEDLAREMNVYFGEKAILGRLGGDEFLIFVRDVSACREQTLQAARAMCTAMNRCYVRNGSSIEVSVSIGLAYAQKDRSFEELYGMADAALYYMKSHGKNNVKVYDASVKDALGNH